MKNTNKAVGGLEFLKAFMISLAVVIVLAFALSLMAGNLSNSVTPDKATVSNESGGYINSTGYSLAKATSDSYLKGSTITAVWVNTSGVNPYLIPATNYTLVENGRPIIYNATKIPNLAEYGSAKISYTYNTQSITQNIIGNFTSGLATLGSNVGTWVTLASLVVIVGIIAVVIYLVSRFGGASEMQ